MNKTKIEWTDYTWNPVTGCRHGCGYCYAHRIAERFKPKHPLGDDCTQPENGLHEIRYSGQPWRYGFEPTFHPYRLTEPYKVKEPSKIFVCSMADLFGSWVPDEWFNKVYVTAFDNQHHIFQFLTKNSKALTHGHFMKNMWVGVSVSTQRDSDRIDDLEFVDASIKYVSFEPLKEDIAFFADEVDWVIVGGQTGPGAIAPDPEWVWKILEECKKTHTPVFLKDNLNWEKEIKEFPNGTHNQSKTESEVG